MTQLAGKVALITGGAGDIGRTTAQRFIEQGASVVLVGRSEERLQQAAASIGSDSCHYYAADISNDEQMRACVEFVLQTCQRLDIVLSNAGISGPMAPVEDYSTADFEDIMRINVTGTFITLKHTMAILKANPDGGSVIITSSGAGLFGLANLSGYVTSKHALTGLMRSTALEGADHAVRVNLIAPGPVKSSMTDAIGADFGMTPDEYEKLISETIPMGRYASLEEVADMMQFLASDASRYCTGCVFPLDGGKAMH